MKNGNMINASPTLTPPLAAVEVKGPQVDGDVTTNGGWSPKSLSESPGGPPFPVSPCKVIGTPLALFGSPLFEWPITETAWVPSLQAMPLDPVDIVVPLPANDSEL